MGVETSEQRVGVRVICVVCCLQKKPRGRSAPAGIPYCDDDCRGYDALPNVGSLWPGETEGEFGHPVADWGTVKIPKFESTLRVQDAPEVSSEQKVKAGNPDAYAGTDGDAWAIWEDPTDENAARLSGEFPTQKEAWEDAASKLSSREPEDAPEVVREAEGKTSMIKIMHPTAAELWASLESFLKSLHKGVCGEDSPEGLDHAQFVVMALRPMIAAAKPLSPDQFEEWFANTFPGLLTLIAKENCSSYGVAKTAWNAALRTRPEGEAKVMWRVDVHKTLGPAVQCLTSSSEAEADEDMDDAEKWTFTASVDKVRIVTTETVIETRTKEPSRG